MKDKPASSIDEYISSFPADMQKKLRDLRALIQEAAPDAVEKISYQMPTFYLNGNLVHFAAHSRHIGFYPTPSAILAFKRELSQYENARGSVQFPMEEPLPFELIRRMVRFRVEENAGKRRGRRRG